MNFERDSPLRLDSVNERLLSQTPLHFACYNGDARLVDDTLSSAARYNFGVEAVNHCRGALLCEGDAINGWTPAHWAAYYGQLSCLMKLNVKQNLGFDTPCHRTNTSPLHLAAQTGAVLCLKWLLQCGAAKDRQDFMGETALHKAAKAGNINIASMLVSNDAALDLKNYHGLTPEDVAVKAGHEILARFLRRSSKKDKLATVNIPISDLGISTLPFPDRLPPLHLPHPDHELYNNGGKISPHLDNFNLVPRHDFNSLCETDSLNGNGCAQETDSTHSDMEDEDFSNNLSIGSNLCRVNGPSLKRPLDDGYFSSQFQVKKQCLGQGITKFVDKIESASNNQVLSSYNAVLAMQLNPRERNEPENLSAHSSLIEHNASIAAQQGYDSQLMETTMQNVFF